MVPFLSKIRHSLIITRKTSRHIKCTIAEIFTIITGILLLLTLGCKRTNQESSKIAYALQQSEFEKKGFGKNTTGGQGGQIYRVSDFSDLKKVIQWTESKRIVEFENDIKLETNIYIKHPDITINGNGHTLNGGMLESEVGNVLIYNLKIDNQKTKGDAFSIVSWHQKTIENIYLLNCELINGKDESLGMRAGHEGGSVKNITIENTKIINKDGYGVLLGPGTENITFYHNYLNSYERNIRAAGMKGFNFEFINNYVENWRNSATNPSQGVRFSVINNYYTSERAKIGSTYIVTIALDGLGNIDNTHAYIKGNVSKQGYGIDKRFDLYLENVPYGSSGISPTAADKIDITKMGVKR